MSANEPDPARRKLFDKHLLGLFLGETDLDEAREALGEPTSVLEEERVLVLEYDSPKESSIARWKKVQFIFFDELLMNVTYSEPEGGLTRAALHKVLGAPDESGDDEAEGEDEDGPSDIFEVDLDEDPMLSFVAHYLADEKVEALSLCADVMEDEAGDDDPGDDEDGEDGEDDDADDEDSGAEDGKDGEAKRGQ